jgi:hypothetical protein
VANLINPGADRRFDVIAALHIWKPFPAAPGLHHAENLNLSYESLAENATTTLRFHAVNASCR